MPDIPVSVPDGPAQPPRQNLDSLADRLSGA
jgi:hypothetical protein